MFYHQAASILLQRLYDKALQIDDVGAVEYSYQELQSLLQGFDS